MDWMHLRKQAVKPEIIAKWDTFLKDADIKISEYDVDEYYHFDSDSIKVKTRSRKEIIVTEEEREDSGRREQAMQRLNEFLETSCN